MPESRVVILSDLHGRFCRWRSWKSVLKFLASFKPDRVVLAGDILDPYTISRWRKNPEEMRTDLNADLRVTFERILQHLRMAVGKAPITYIPGNHEDWLDRYLRDNAPELYGIRRRGDKSTPEVLTVPWLLDLGSLKIDWNGGVPFVLNRRLLCIHGGIIRKNSTWSVRALMERYKTSIIAGDCHRMGMYYETGYGGREWVGAENGHICDPNKLEYTGDVTNWQSGFTIAYLHPGNLFHLEQAKLLRDKVYYAGRVYGG